MKQLSILLTEEEDNLLSAYGASLGKDPADIVAENGKSHAIQSALRVFANAVSASGAIDQAIAAEVLKDSGAVFNAVWNDWQGKKLFAPLVATHLQASPAPDRSAQLPALGGVR